MSSARYRCRTTTRSHRREITKYNYLGTPAWHADDNEVTKPAERTYGQFRGYAEVDIRTGNSTNQSNGSDRCLDADQDDLLPGHGRRWHRPDCPR